MRELIYKEKLKKKDSEIADKKKRIKQWKKIN